MSSDYDVIVVGGGSAGLVAAIQAGRAGARTLLVEKNGLLGGTTTAGGVCAPGLFHAWGRQVVAGIGWELVSRAVAEARGTMPDFSYDRQNPRRHSSYHVRVNIAIFAALADEDVVAAPADILFHAMPAEARFDGKRWQVTLCTKTGLHKVSTAVLVDCTGDAGVAQLAHLPVDRHEPMQPGTLIFRIDGYDTQTLDWPVLQAAFDKALAQGRILKTDFGWSKTPLRAMLNGHGMNAMHVCHIDGTTSQGRTQAELAGRAVMMRIFRFLRELPGLERLTIGSVSPEVGIRETVVIRGRTSITAQDYLAGRRFDDALCYSFYPIDIHTADDAGLNYRMLDEGVVPTIPRGAMLPADAPMFVAAGRHICGDRGAYSAYRTQATCMATGQAAGAMAALSARSHAEPADLDLADIRSLLAQHGAIVP